MRRGGGLIITAGDNVADNLDSYNKLLFKQNKGILPAQSQGRSGSAGRQSFFARRRRVALPATAVARFPGFHLSLHAPPCPIFQIPAVIPTAGPSSRTLFFRPEGPQRANLPNEDPALLEWNPPLPAGEAQKEGEPSARQPLRLGPRLATRYRGKVILVTTTVNPDWTSRPSAGTPGWHNSGSFLPLMQQLWRLAVSGKVRDQAVLVGQPLQEVLGSGESPLKARVFAPGGKKEGVETLTQTAEGLTLFQWSDTDQAGVYRVTLGNEPTDYLFAVNPPASTGETNDSESDLSRVEERRLLEIFSGLNFKVLTKPEDAPPPANVFSDQEVWPVRNGPPIAYWLLLSVLGLMLLEVVLACVFAHFTVVPGLKQPPRLRLLGPVVTAALALVAVVAVSATFLQAAANNNDFLSFLPESAGPLGNGSWAFSRRDRAKVRSGNCNPAPIVPCPPGCGSASVCSAW